MYIARQPILDRQRRIVGYELLFRSPGGLTDGVLATSSVVSSVFAGGSIADALGPHRGFVNVDAAFLGSDMVFALPAPITVIELLESIEFTPELVARCQTLKQAGYQLASDDYRGERAAIEPVLPLLDIVKVDLPVVGHEGLVRIARDLTGTRLLAEKVETAEEFRLCMDAGYSLFQGYHFAKPATIGAVACPADKLAILNILGMLAREVPDGQLEEAVKRAPEVGLRLLRLVNSAAAGLRVPVASMRQALYRLGRSQLRSWMLIAAYTAGSDGAGVDEQPLLQTAAVRAKTMELLAARCGVPPEEAFIAGLVSLFDVETGLGVGELAERLSLSGPISRALVSGEGPIGRLLSLTIAMERGADDAVAARLAELPVLDDALILSACAAAMRWASQLGEEEGRAA